MANITNDTMRLLDRLFNLKGEDNVIIKEIKERIEETNNRIAEVTASQKENEVGKVNCEGRLSVFQNQKEAFESAFEGLDNETFAALRDIDVDVAIGTMLVNIEERAPKFIDDLNEQIETFKKAIESDVQTKEELEEKLSGLEEDKAKSEDDRDKLVSLLEQSLSSDEVERESLTASYVKKILTLFEVFSEEEIKDLAKLIIFPDEGLYEYQEGYEERLANGFVDTELEEVEQDFEEEQTMESEMEAEIASQDEVVASDEVKDTSVILESTQQAAEIYQDTTEEDLDKTSFIDIERLNQVRQELAEVGEYDQSEEVIHEDIVVPDEESIPEEVSEETEEAKIELTSESEEVQEEDTLNEIETFLENIGFNYDILTETEKTDLLNLLKDTPHTLIESNYELLRSLNVVEVSRIYANNLGHNYLADEDLAKKVTLLRAKNIPENVIKQIIESPNREMRESYDTFENRIKAIEEVFGKLNEENIGYLASDMESFLNNYKTLQNNGYEIEEKELRNYEAVLENSKNVSADVEILKKYLISILKKNGKYELGIFWQDPQALITGIDDLIEADLEDLIVNHPEVLAQNLESVLRRIKFCQEQGHPVYEDGNTFCDYISDFTKFNKKYGNGVELPNLEDKNNSSLGTVIGNEDYVDILVNTLNDYYGSESYSDIELSEEAKTTYEDIKQQIVDKLGATPTGKHTYKVGTVCISKNKFERHLSIILNALVSSGQSPDGVEREILLVSALYNLRQDEETLNKMVSECLGFNNGEALGGKQL